MNRLFAALLAILLLALPIAAFAEGTDPTASEPPEATSSPAETQTPTITPEPTPEPTPVVEQLIIDSRNLYDGMDRTYAQGYVPRVVNGCCYIIFPLIGETYDGKVTVTADLGATADSPFVFGNYSQTAAGWGRYVFMFEIPLVKGRINGSYPVTLKADYLDVLGQQKQQNFTVFVTVSDGKKPKDPDAKEAAEKPELFISACEITPGTVGGDGEFSVNVKIDNIGSIRARSVRLTYGSEAEGILPYDTNNAILLDNIASGEGAEAEFKMRTTKDVIAGSRAFFITLDYVDLYGGVYTATRQFLVNVTQPAEMTYDAISLPKSVTAGETFTLPANVFNIGKSPLRNVTVNLTGAGLFPTSSVFLGDIQPGQAGYGELKVFVGMLSMTEGYTESYGKTTGVYTISYKDDAGEEYAVSVDFATEIQKPVIEGEKTDAEKKAEEEQKRAMSQWWISALAAFAAISIVVAVIVVSRFARMMRMK